MQEGTSEYGLNSQKSSLPAHQSVCKMFFNPRLRY